MVEEDLFLVPSIWRDVIWFLCEAERSIKGWRPSEVVSARARKRCGDLWTAILIEFATLRLLDLRLQEDLWWLKYVILSHSSKQDKAKHDKKLKERLENEDSKLDSRKNGRHDGC